VYIHTLATVKLQIQQAGEPNACRGHQRRSSSCWWCYSYCLFDVRSGAWWSWDRKRWTKHPDREHLHKSRTAFRECMGQREIHRWRWWKRRAQWHPHRQLAIMLATDRNSPLVSDSGSTWNWTLATGLNTRKTQPIGNGPVLPLKSQHLKIATFPAIKYLSSDRVVTWSVRRMCSSSRSFTSRSQICDPTNIRSVAIENPLISFIMCPYFTATEWILVWLQIWMLEMKELVKQHNL